MEIPQWKLVRQYHDQVFFGKNKRKCILGRGKFPPFDPTVENNPFYIIFKSAYISKFHCEIAYCDEEQVWKIQDLKSCNGTFLNEVRLKDNQRREVRHRDLIGLGVSGSEEDVDLQDERIYIFRFFETERDNDVEIIGVRGCTVPCNSAIGSVRQQNRTASSPRSSSSQSPGPSRVLRQEILNNSNVTPTNIETSSSDDSSDGLSDRSSVKSVQSTRKKPKLATARKRERKVKNIVKPKLIKAEPVEIPEVIEIEQNEMPAPAGSPRTEIRMKECSVKLQNFLQMHKDGKNVIVIPPAPFSGVTKKATGYNNLAIQIKQEIKREPRDSFSDSDESHVSGGMQYSQTFDESEDDSVVYLGDHFNNDLEEPPNNQISDTDDNSDVMILDIASDHDEEDDIADSYVQECTYDKTIEIPKEPEAESSASSRNRSQNKRKLSKSPLPRQPNGSPSPYKKSPVLKKLENNSSIPLSKSSVKIKKGVQNESFMSVPASTIQSDPKIPNDDAHYSRDPRLNRAKNVVKEKGVQPPIIKDGSILNTDTIYKDICKWRVVWLKEHKKGIRPPRFERENHYRPALEVLSVLNLYKNYETYQRVFYPLILHELWATIKKDYYQNENLNGFKSTVTLEKCTFLKVNPLVSLTDSHSETCGQWVQVRCYNDTNIIKDSILNHNLCIFDYYVSNQSGDAGFQKYSTFAFIKYCAEDFEEVNGPDFKYKYSFDIIFHRNSNQRFDIAMGLHGNIHNLACISTILQSYQAFMSLRNTSLCANILNPQRIENHWTFNKQARYESLVSHCKGLNQMQKSVVEYAAARIMQNGQPDIMLLYGAPGTGKTKTIASLILQLVTSRQFESKSPCILVSSPSSVALDQIISYLAEFFNGMKESHRPNLVRIKEADKPVAPWATNYLPESIAAKKIHMHKNGTTLDALCADIIRSAQIICCPLNFCANPKSKLKDYFQVTNSESTNSQLRKFSCCIIDEAIAATEMECLSPLTFNFNKLLLVGDPKLMDAKVLSKKCKENKYNRSLFHRLYDYFRKQVPSPVMVLQNQYRMHEEIFKWSNHYFYGGKLITKPIRKTDIECPLLPLLFCSYTSESTTNGSLSSEVEIHLIVEVLKAIWNQISFLKNQYSIGVILPDAKDRVPLINKIKQKLPQFSKKVEVDVLEMFQGREKDIVVFPCFPSEAIEFIGGHKLNVILSRVKHSLVIIGNTDYLKSANIILKSLVEDAEFRKLVHQIPADKISQPGFVSNRLCSIFEVRTVSEIPEERRLPNRLPNV